MSKRMVTLGEAVVTLEKRPGEDTAVVELFDRTLSETNPVQIWLVRNPETGQWLVETWSTGESNPRKAGTILSSVKLR